MEYNINTKTSKIATNENNIIEIQERLKQAETIIGKLQGDYLNLSNLKLDRYLFEDEVKKTKVVLDEHTSLI